MLYKKILQEVENINQLPTYNELVQLIKDNKECDADAELEELCEAFIYGEIVEIRDGTKIRLTNEVKCVLHPLNYRYFDEYSFAYEIVGENIYICANCLTVAQAMQDLVREYLGEDEEYIFPIKWDKNRVKNWLKNKEEKNKEYEKKRDHFRREDAEDEEFEDDDEE